MPVPPNFKGSRVKIGPDGLDSIGFHYRQQVRRGLLDSARQVRQRQLEEAQGEQTLDVVVEQTNEPEEG